MSKHGAQTTLAQQYTRATTGIAPDGSVGRPIDASRFLTNKMELAAYQKAQQMYKQTAGGARSIIFEMSEFIGEGFTKGGIEYKITKKVEAKFNASGEMYTMFPKLK